MIVAAKPPITDRLRSLLSEMYDDGTAPLVVEQDGTRLRIRRNDGTELSERETTHVRGVLAAHRVQPIK